ncbi:putative O-methyltransferase [Candidatus Phycosocius bacilliformis]|uniref:Putative O-methyltransferase n=1 Tax=Candidatus Phycosocius bacilliformis TaxID=1445552 RepID=A0A2P2EA02_9PROT|nr:class I SAM-dependent methyltransferase [Candidatus Phycosocius bacilliformis]GBF57886.1 putative O-methyltransferase [Candidatus Phycosocius bacilliformis]
MSTSFSLSPALVNYLAAVNPPEHPALEACRAETANHPRAVMQISAEQGAFMHFLLRLMDVRLAVEVGVFTGYSALVTALALRQNAGPGGRLFAFDISEEFTNLARTYWHQAGVDSTIDLRIGPASDGLEGLIDQGYGGRIDFIFVDADKPAYRDYYEKGLTLLRTGGVMLFDNMLWSGKVADATAEDPETLALRELAAFAQGDNRVRAVTVAIGDGLMLVSKL